MNTHPGYDTYVPVDRWADHATRPRVATYVRKGNHLEAQQRRPWDCRDLLWISVNGYNLVNVYRAPLEPTSRTTKLLLDFKPPPNCIVAGDFNAPYSLWEPTATAIYNAGCDIARWAATHTLAYIGEAGVPTHSAGHVLDLTFSNIPFATAEIDDALHAGADHEGIFITAPPKGMSRPPQHRIAISDQKIDAFAGLVAMGADNLAEPSAAPSHPQSSTRWQRK